MKAFKMADSESDKACDMPQETGLAEMQPFPFSNLPPETQLRILDHTDILGPTHLFIWTPLHGFALPAAAKPKARRGSWRCPKNLFLVSRAFYCQVRGIFWRKNTFNVGPDNLPFFERIKPGEPSRFPMRYAASQFLATQAFSAEMLINLRSLHLELFGKIVGSEVGEAARQDWFRSVNLAISQGLRLRSLYVSLSPSDELEWDTVNCITSDEGMIQKVRKFVHSRVWPLEIAETPAGIPKHLLVEISSLSALSRYEIHDNCGISLGQAQKRHLEKKKTNWGPPTVSRQLSLPKVLTGDDKDTRPSPREEIWVESVWFHKDEQTY